MSLEAVVQKLSEITQQTVNDYSTYDFGRQQETKAKSITVEEEIARSTLFKIRKEITPEIIAFIGTTRNYATNETRKAEIVVARGESQFDILRLAHTDAGNYGLSTEDIIAKLKIYDRSYGIDIFQAESDVVNFTLKNFPQDLTAFCQDLYEFCPDIVDQGVGSINKLKESVEILGEIYLWWD